MGYQIIAEQARTIEVSLSNRVLDGLGDLREIFYDGGSSLVSTPQYGSFECAFIGSDAAVAATRSLKFNLPRVL